MELALRDRVIVITGGSAGIGRASAIELAREGARVVVGARDAEGLADLEKEIRDRGGEVVAVTGDLVEQQGVDALVDTGVDGHGRVDGLVACVGSTPVGDFDELTDDVWQRAFTMKFLSTVRAVRRVLPEMRRRGEGRIVIVAGNSAHGPTPWMATSGAINAALVNLTSNLAQQYAPEGVGVTCVNPGPTGTARYDGMRSAVMNREGLDEESAAAWIRARIPDGRVGEPEEVARVVAFLLSPSASHISGTSVVVDGAQTYVR